MDVLGVALSAVTPRNQTQAPAKRRSERIACNTQILDRASLGRLGFCERDYGMQEVVVSVAAATLLSRYREARVECSGLKKELLRLLDPALGAPQFAQHVQ